MFSSKSCRNNDQNTSNNANHTSSSGVKREPHKREAPPDRENGSAKKRPRPSAQALPPPAQVPDDAGPSHLAEVELEEDPEAGPSNIKAEMVGEENFEAGDEYAGGEEESYYDEGAYEGTEDMGAVGGATGDESKGRLINYHFSERLVSVAPLAGCCGFHAPMVVAVQKATRNQLGSINTFPAG